jgi:hypothetical protein
MGGEAEKDTEPPKPTTTQNQPEIGAAKQEKKGGGQQSEMQKKMERIGLIADKFGKLAALIGFIVDVIVIGVTLTFLGPVGWLIAVVIALIKAGGPGAILDGFEALAWFISELAAWIWSLMPDWFQSAWQTIKRLISMGAAGAAKEVGTNIRDACPQLIDAPWAEVAQPMFDWAAKLAETLILAFEGFRPSNPLDWILLILKLMLGALSGIKELINAIQEVGRRLAKLIRTLVHTGEIVVHCTDVDDWGMNPWLVKCNLPGICSITWGPNDDNWLWLICQFANGILKNWFGATPNTNTSTSDYGFNY